MTEEKEPEISAEMETETEVSEADLLTLAEKEGLVDNMNVEAGGAEGADSEDRSVSAELSPEQAAHLKAAMETILFMSDRPLSLPRLRSIIDPQAPLAAYRQLMVELRAESLLDHRGVEIAEVSMGFQLRTKPHMAQVLRKLVKTTPLKLSPTNLEVLAAVAYKQPLTKDELDQIRGVDSGYVLRSLMEKHLVRISGRSDLPGRPMLYATTHEFLELFSLKDLTALPPLHEVEQLVAQSEVGDEQAEQDALQDFGKMVEGSTKVLFEDSGIDAQVEELRAEIAAIPTSTAFIDEQKAQEKRAVKLAELALQGLTLDAEDNIVPLATLAPNTETVTDTGTEHRAPLTEHNPSPELLQAAQQAQQERHLEAISKTIDESVPAIAESTSTADPLPLETPTTADETL